MQLKTRYTRDDYQGKVEKLAAAKCQKINYITYEILLKYKSMYNRFYIEREVHQEQRWKTIGLRKNDSRNVGQYFAEKLDDNTDLLYGRYTQD